MRFEGPGTAIDACFSAVNGRPLIEQPLNRIVFGHWGRDVMEEVVLCRVAEDLTEIHCHGGDAAAERIRRDIESEGGKSESWQAMLERTQGLFQTEWTEAISKATTMRTAEFLLAQREVFPNAIQELQAAIVSSPPAKICDALDAILKWAEFGRHLTVPWSVVLGGPPNVGKSSLINALVGYARSIVYDQPGTTRDVVTAETAFEGWPILLSDTAGLRNQADVLEAEGIARAKKRLASADCRVLLFDVSGPPTETDQQLCKEFPDAILVAHKSDLAKDPQQEMPTRALPVSSLTGEGVELLMKRIIERLIPDVPPIDQAIPFTERQADLLKQARSVADSEDAQSLGAILSEIAG